MRRTNTIFLALILFSISTQSFAQKFSKKEVALISYKVSIDQDYYEKFTAFSSLFREPVKPELDRITSHLTVDIWYLIKQRLTDDVGMLLLPIDAYGEKFSYNEYGFPDVGINRALRKGNSKYYISIDVDFSPEFAANYINKIIADSSQIVQLKENQLKPKVTIKMNIYNNRGVIPVKIAKGEALSKDIIDLDEKYFDGFVNSNFNTQHETLYKLVNEAINNLIISVYSR